MMFIKMFAFLCCLALLISFLGLPIRKCLNKYGEDNKDTVIIKSTNVYNFDVQVFDANGKEIGKYRVPIDTSYRVKKVLIDSKK